MLKRYKCSNKCVLKKYSLIFKRNKFLKTHKGNCKMMATHFSYMATGYNLFLTEAIF
jgi:hypothetical protein